MSKLYLIAYNAASCIGWMSCLYSLYTASTLSVSENAYSSLAGTLQIVQSAAILEVNKFVFNLIQDISCSSW